MTDLDDRKTVLDEKFAELNKLKDEKTKLIAFLRNSFDTVKELQAKKSKIVGFIRQKKDERSKAQNEIKAKSGVLKKVIEKKRDLDEVDDYGRLLKRIDKIEWTIWTESIPYKKEEELVKLRRELEADLEKAKEKESFSKDEHIIRDKLQDVVKEQKLLHNVILMHSKEWEKYNSELKELFSGITEKKKKIDEISSRMTAVKSEIDAVKGDMSKVRQGAMAERQKQEKKDNAVKQKNMSKKVNEIREKFKKCKKLTTDDLIVLGGCKEDIF